MQYDYLEASDLITSQPSGGLIPSPGYAGGGALGGGGGGDSGSGGGGQNIPEIPTDDDFPVPVPEPATALILILGGFIAARGRDKK